MAETVTQKVLVVGSINVDLYQHMKPSSVKLAWGDQLHSTDLKGIKGMTLPAKRFLEHPSIASQGVTFEAGGEEALVMTMEGPFTQKTGGKGANAAAAAGQTSACELICNFGTASETANEMLLADLKQFGNVDTSRAGRVEGPTGTAYILIFEEDHDNAILLLGGGNTKWDVAAPVTAPMQAAIEDAVAVMLQREVPDFVNVAVAQAARKSGKPVIMDVGGTDVPLDSTLIPFISVVAPNESELAAISGVDTAAAMDGKSLPEPVVRMAVAALKAKCKEAGNDALEVLVTLGAQGSMHFAADWDATAAVQEDGRLAGETRMGHFDLATADGKPVDTTGAGDCYRGSYVAAKYGEGKTVVEAMTWAAAAGSLAVEVEGAMPSMPTRAAIEARMAMPLK